MSGKAVCDRHQHAYPRDERCPYCVRPADEDHAIYQDREESDVPTKPGHQVPAWWWGE